MIKYSKKLVSTNKVLKNILMDFSTDIEKKYLKQPQAIIDYWPKVIGEKLSSMTNVIKFENGILYVLVKSSTLYSILKGVEKKRILKLMQQKFTKNVIFDINFYVG
ncbi:MAG: hypothetical protein A3F40_04270 [Chlamydiae bacterium RIFCSPHIGHO2_12_FULL_27_8]|nr:MAG: hypothetical protein A3F40_04270 [Chlamydiae bacterium RIFCSPHIGHO2_12_FULL_27_8]OGN65941.1 MAG: hypothetical protein A2888_02380 [Chlamydiae bacterium RIFCSPLOWO2_01_FULL_28_7]